MGNAAIHGARAIRPLMSRGIMTSTPARAGMYAYSPVKTDPKVEKWAAHREDIEETFEFTHKNTWRVGLFALTVPALIYAVTVAEFRQTDATYGANKDPNSRGATKKYL